MGGNEAKGGNDAVWQDLGEGEAGHEEGSCLGLYAFDWMAGEMATYMRLG